MSQPAPASTPGAALLPDTTGLFTAAHLAWIAVFAVLAVLTIAWGIRQRQQRARAKEEVEEFNAQVVASRTQNAAPSPVDTPEQAAPSLVVPVPVAPAPPPLDTGPVPGPAPTDAAAADGPVTQLKGLGPKLAGRLAELGVTTGGRMAALTDDEAATLDAQLGPFAGRMTRDRWLEQARFLAAGDRAGFEAVFGRL